MERTVYYLGTCDTCKRILKDLALKEKGFTLREIKSQPVSQQELKQLISLAGGVSELLNKQSRSYKTLSDEEKSALTATAITNGILKDYTWLKRPAVVIGKKIFAGNAKVTLLALKEELDRL